MGVGTAAANFKSSDLDNLFLTGGTAATFVSVGSGTVSVTTDPASIVGIDTTAVPSFTYATSIPANTMGLAKLGPNTLILTGSNQYSGPTTVAGGTLQIGNGADGANLVNTSGISLSNNSTVLFKTAESVSLLNVPISGAGNLCRPAQAC